MREIDLFSGLLAGLHEFPTVSNVSGAAVMFESAPKIVDEILTSLLIHPPSPFRKGSKSQESRGEMMNGTLQVATIKPVGDVVHVFSHIKKTYRIQWVILEGGKDEPPELYAEACMSTVSTCGRDKRRKISSASKGEKLSGSSNGAVAARWVPLEEVESAK